MVKRTASSPKATPSKAASTPSKATPKDKGKGKEKATPASTKRKTTSPKNSTKKSTKRSDEVDEPTTALFDAIKGKGALAITVDEWIERYDENADDAIRELVDLVALASGSNVSINGDVYDANDYPAAVNALEESAGLVNIVDYPLASRKAELKRFRTTYVEFWDKLITKGQRRLIYDDYLIEKLSGWLASLSSCRLKSFRHSASVASYQIITSLVQVAIEVRKDMANAHRRQAAEPKGTQRAKQMQEQGKIAHDRLVLIEGTMIAGLFTNVFIHRYRDTNADIRSSSVGALGSWVTAYPQLFLADNYIKYLGWMLNDTNPEVRRATVQALVTIYEQPDNISSLDLFTRKFKPRIVEMATIDKEVDIATDAISLCDLLATHEMLEPRELEAVFGMIVHESPRVRAAAGKLMYEQMLSETEDHLNKRTAKTKKEEQQLRNMRRQQVITIVDFALEHNPLPNMPAYVVEALLPLTSALRDWPTMTDLLLADDDEHTLNERQQGMLVSIMAAAARAHLSPKTDIPFAGMPDAEAKVTQKQEKAMKEAKLHFSNHFIGTISDLIAKFQDDVEKVQELVWLPQLFLLDQFVETHRSVQFTDLLGLLMDEDKGMFFRHDDETVLDNISRTLKHFLSSSISTVSQEAMVAVRGAVGLVDSKLGACIKDEVTDDNFYELKSHLKKILALSKQNKVPEYFDDIYQKLAPLLDRTSLGYKALDPEALTLIIGIFSQYIMWTYASLGPRPSSGAVHHLKEERDKFLGQLLGKFLDHKSDVVCEKAFTVAMDQMLLFGPRLGQIPAYRDLVYQGREELIQKAINFYEGRIHRLLEARRKKVVSTEQTDDIEEDKDEDEEEEEEEEEAGSSSRSKGKGKGKGKAASSKAAKAKAAKAKAKPNKGKGKAKAKAVGSPELEDEEMEDEEGDASLADESVDDLDEHMHKITTAFCMGVRFGVVDRVEAGAVLVLLSRGPFQKGVTNDVLKSLLNNVRTKDKQNEWIIVHDALRKQYLSMERVRALLEEAQEDTSRSASDRKQHEQALSATLAEETKVFKDLARMFSLSYAFQIQNYKENIAHLVYEGIMFSLGADQQYKGRHLGYLSAMEPFLSRLPGAEATMVHRRVAAWIDENKETFDEDTDQPYFTFREHLDKARQHGAPTPGKATPASARRGRPPGSANKANAPASAKKKAARKLELDFEKADSTTPSKRKRESPRKRSSAPVYAETSSEEEEEEDEDEDMQEAKEKEEEEEPEVPLVSRRGRKKQVAEPEQPSASKRPRRK